MSAVARLRAALEAQPPRPAPELLPTVCDCCQRPLPVGKDGRRYDCRRCRQHAPEHCPTTHPCDCPSDRCRLGTGDPRHGTANAHKHHRCRCAPCVEANREACAARRPNRPRRHTTQRDRVEPVATKKRRTGPSSDGIIAGLKPVPGDRITITTRCPTHGVLTTDPYPSGADNDLQARMVAAVDAALHDCPQAVEATWR